MHITPLPNLRAELVDAHRRRRARTWRIVNAVTVALVAATFIAGAVITYLGGA